MKTEGPREGLTILRIDEVCRKTGVSRPTIYRMIRDGEFPKGHALSKGTVGWNAAEVEQWIADKLGLTEPKPIH